MINEILKEAGKKGYCVDIHGNVWSKTKQLALRKAQDRYQFTIRYYGKRVTIPVHKFVAYLKFGDEIFKEGIEVRHLDGNSLNNGYENISIGTHTQNMRDISRNL